MITIIIIIIITISTFPITGNTFRNPIPGKQMLRPENPAHRTALPTSHQTFKSHTRPQAANTMATVRLPAPPPSAIHQLCIRKIANGKTFSRCFLSNQQRSGAAFVPHLCPTRGGRTGSSAQQLYTHQQWRRVIPEQKHLEGGGQAGAAATLHKSADFSRNDDVDRKNHYTCQSL